MEATEEQLALMNNLHNRSEQNYQDWMAGEERKRLVEQIRDGSPLRQDIRLDWSKRFVFMRESETLTACHEAGWVALWAMVPPKYALTEDGWTQLQLAKKEANDKTNEA